MFLCIRPAPPLDAFVEHLWASERPALAHARERSLPTGCADIVIPLLQTHLIRHDGEADASLHRLRGPVLQGTCDRYLVRGGPARFIERFRNTIGLTPKRYGRVRRLQAVLQQVVAPGPVDWAALSLDAGFVDQAHLGHEFRRMTGSTPGSYRPVAPSQPNHVAIPGPA